VLTWVNKLLKNDFCQECTVGYQRVALAIFAETALFQQPVKRVDRLKGQMGCAAGTFQPFTLLTNHAARAAHPRSQLASRGGSARF
jgi:hypothetical protein